MKIDASNIAHFHSESQRGLYYATDESGYLVPPFTGISAITGLNRMVINDLIVRLNTLLSDKMIAVYFRGSQLFSERLSDFDTIVVLEQIENYDSVSLSTELNRFFAGQYFHINHFDTLVIERRAINQNRNFQFLLKVLSVHVWGIPIHLEYSGFKPNNDVVFLLKKLPEKLSQVISEIQFLSNTDKYKACNYLIKFLIRSAFELIICYEGRYTRELNTCQSLFSRHFPQYGNAAYEILCYYNRKDFDIAEFTRLASGFAEILHLEYQRTSFYGK